MTTFSSGISRWYDDEQIEKIYVGYRGSIAHGMYVPANDPKHIDDIDTMGVYIAPVDHYLGIIRVPTTIEKKDSPPYDEVYYELQHFISLLLKGNPNVLSLLWIDETDILLKEEAGILLRAERDIFLSQAIYSSFAGYASGQLQKMELREPADLRFYLAVTHEARLRGIHPNKDGYLPEPGPQTNETKEVARWDNDKIRQVLKSYQKKGNNTGYLGDKRKQLVLEHGYDCKNAAHCIRLLRMGAEVLRTGTLVVNRQKAGDAQELLDIKRGLWPLEKVKQHAEELFQQLKDTRETSVLPKEPNKTRANALTIEILKGRGF